MEKVGLRPLLLAQPPLRFRECRLQPLLCLLPLLAGHVAVHQLGALLGDLSAVAVSGWAPTFQRDTQMDR